MPELILPDEGVDEKAKATSASQLLLPPGPDPVAVANAREAAAGNADAFAKTKAIADRMALPVPVVERNLPALDSEDKVRAVQERMARDPFYADRMRDPNFAKLSQGDEDNLSIIEKVARDFNSTLRGAAAGFGPDIASSIYGLGETGLKVIAPVLDPLVGRILPQNPIRLVAGGLEGLRKRAESLAQTVAGPQPEGIVGQGIVSGFRSFGQMAPGLAAAIATRDPRFALGAGGALVGSQSATKALDAGKSPMQALTYGMEDAVAEVATEMLPMGVLLRDLRVGASFKRVLAHQIATEVPTELLATAWQQMNEYATLHPEKTFKDYMTELGPAEAQTAIATITTTILTAGFGKVGQHVLNQRLQDKQVDSDAENLKNLFAFAADSKLRERSPATFADFITAATKDGPVDAVYADAAVFMQAAQAAGVDLKTAMPETAAALDDALATKSDVKIPLSELATVAPGTTLEQSIIPHLKTDPNGATQTEIADKAWVEDTRKQTERVLAEHEFTDAWKESTGKVKAELFTQLKDANRFTSDVNDAYAGFMAAFYSTQAHRLGITPEEMYVKYPLQIRATEVTGERTFAQPPATMQDFMPGQVKGILQKDNWTILTAENPNAKPLPPEENAARMVQLKNALDKRKLKYVDVNGKYGSEEHSLLITGITPAQAVTLGEQFGQESVLTPAGLVYRDGSVNPATGVTEHETLPEDFYSVVPSTGAAFSVDINFDKKERLIDVLWDRALKQEQIVYTGHAGNGGLQTHSLGDMYPWTVIGQGDLNPTLYRAKNLITNEEGPLRSSYAEARGDVDVKRTTFNQDLPTSWYYSELGRQIDLAKMESAPAQGWKDYIRGLTQKGVKPMEIEATGINEWLDFIAESAKPGENTAQIVRDISGATNDAFPRGKVTKQQVQTFLRENGVQVTEVLLNGQRPNKDYRPPQEVTYSESDWEVEDPDDEYIEDNAKEHYLEKYKEELAEKLGVEVDDLTESQEDEALNDAIVQVRDDYYNDDESPKLMAVDISTENESANYIVTQAYGETTVRTNNGGRQRNVPIEGDDYEQAIREHAAEHYSIYEDEGEGEEGSPNGVQYADYSPFDSDNKDNDNYFELLLTLPGAHKFSAPHFGDVENSNMIAHIRADTQEVNGKNVLRIQEIQSDWAQQGREKGFTDKNKKIDTTGWVAVREGSTWSVSDASGNFERNVNVSHAPTEDEAIALAAARAPVRGIEPAPFVTKTDAWVALVWKRMIRYAAENDIDQVIWSRGDQQVEQWSSALRKRVDFIEWVKTDAGVQLLGFKGRKDVRPDWKLRQSQPNGDWVVESEDSRELARYETEALARDWMERHSNVGTSEKVVDTTYKEDALSDAIGKTMGKQILESSERTGTIEGSDITIDDIGMAQFYGDASGRTGSGKPAILTKVVNEVLKKYGAQPTERLEVGIIEGKTTFTYTGAYLTPGEVQVLADKANDPELSAPQDWRDVIDKVQHYMKVGSMNFKGAIEAVADRYSDDVQSLLKSDLMPFNDSRLTINEPTEIGQPGFVVTPELKAKALAGFPLFQPGARGQITFGNDIKQQPSVITLLANADLSTFLHETGHFYLEVLSDMAGQKDAHPQVVDDLAMVLNWFGLTDNLPRGKTPAEVWRTMSLEEKRPYHEQWARGMEAYLFEGKSPSIEMQTLFGRFRAWMINVYQQLTRLNVELTNDVRGVMDRLLATNDEIVQAETARSFMPMYSAKPEGMSDADWQAYQKLGSEATQAAVDTLQTRSLRDMQYASNAKAEVLKQLQQQASEKRKGIRAEVTAEVMADPVYAAMAGLRNGWTQDDGTKLRVKLSTSAIAEMYANTLNRPDLTGLGRMATADGIHPDEVAQLTGFGSGDELVRKLLAAEPMRQKIDGLTDQRMLERYGDLADPASMEKAANAAVHNDVRGRFLATELRSLDKATGKRSVLIKAAKDFASTLIARKKVRSIKPNTYAAAEARAAKAAERSVASGDLVAAATEKRTQLVNLYAAKAAYDALAEVEKSVAYLKRVGDSKTIDAAYREQINALLERFDLRKTTAKEAQRRVSLVQWIESQREQNMEPAIDPALENEALRKPYQEMTLEEFRGLTDSIRNIEHLGRLKNRLLTLADKRAFAVVVDDIVGSITANAKRVVPQQLEHNTWTDKMKGGFAEFFAMHRKFANMLREMDGYRDTGILQRILVHTSNAAGATEALMHEAATIKLSELMKPIFASGKLNKKTFIPAINASLSREGRIMVALNTGNEGNLQRLMDGDHWTPVQVQAVLDTLTKQEMDFVQGVWDFAGSYRAQIGEQQKRLTGLEPAWIEPRPVKTIRGEYRGGYIPAKYDTTRSTRSLSDEAAAGLIDAWRAKRGAAQTSRSFTKERANKVVDRPLRKDFGVITQHVTEVTHRLSWQDWLVDTNRLLRARGIDEAIREHYGAEVLKALRDAVEDIAAGQVPAQNAFERSVNYLRTGATIAGLGWRVTTSLLQPIGLTQSMVRIGPKWVVRGLAQWIGDAAHMENTAKKIYDKSDFMRLRAKTMQREISEIRDQVSGKNSKIEASYFYLIQKMQLVADIPTWLGQYEKAVEGGADEKGAIAQADQAVIDAQGSGQIKDLAAIQRGGPLMKLFTNFYSFFSTTYNLTSEAVGRTDFKSPGQIGLLAVDFLLLYSLPAALGTLMKWALSDDDDEDKLVRNLIADQIGYLFGTMVGLREVAGVARTAAGLPGDYSGPAGLRAFGAVTSLGKQIGQGEADEPFWKALNSTGGLLFHYPAGQINATVDGLVTLADGRTNNPGVLLVGSTKK